MVIFNCYFDITRGYLFSGRFKNIGDEHPMVSMLIGTTFPHFSFESYRLGRLDQAFGEEVIFTELV